ncbi:MAG: HD domain-containing protein [Candidatus Cloacimonetes bacterium]|nr:HD domain-containing protein [Candidatus Cloacimonadota bacterium]
MENKLFVNEIGQYLNKEIMNDFLVSQKELREGTKDFYLRLKLTDKTGSISANVWNNAQTISEKFKEGDIIRIKGIVISYKSQIQITVNKVRVLNEDEYDLSEFIATSSKDINKLSDKLFQYIENIKDVHLKKLLLEIFEDKDFFKLFLKSPAAKTWHHNFIGGLIEHTISVVSICDFVSFLYPVDKDLLISSALLHDIGKVYEYNVKSTIDFTPMGRLIGHISLGDQIIYEKAAKINNFPKNTLMKLRHLILAHHGEYEKASVRLPQMLEAIVLHHADNLDAQTVGVKQIIESVQNDKAEWSEYDVLNNRYYYIK